MKSSLRRVCTQRLSNQRCKLNRNHDRKISLTVLPTWNSLLSTSTSFWTTTHLGTNETNPIPEILHVSSSECTGEWSLASKTSGGSLNSTIQRARGGGNQKFISVTVTLKKPTHTHKNSTKKTQHIIVYNVELPPKLAYTLI